MERDGVMYRGFASTSMKRTRLGEDAAVWVDFDRWTDFDSGADNVDLGDGFGIDGIVVVGIAPADPGSLTMPTYKTFFHCRDTHLRGSLDGHNGYSHWSWTKLCSTDGLATVLDMIQSHLWRSVRAVQTDLAFLVVVLVVGPLISQFERNFAVMAADVASEDCLPLVAGSPDVQGSCFHS